MSKDEKNDLEINLEKYKNFCALNPNPLIHKKGKAKYKGSYYSLNEINYAEEEKAKAKIKNSRIIHQTFLCDDIEDTERKENKLFKSPLNKFSNFKKAIESNKEDYYTLKSYTDIQGYIFKHFKSNEVIQKWINMKNKMINNPENNEEIKIMISIEPKSLLKPKTLIIPVEDVLVSIVPNGDESADSTFTTWNDVLQKKTEVK